MFSCRAYPFLPSPSGQERAGRLLMRRSCRVLKLFTIAALAAASTTTAFAQAPPPTPAEATAGGGEQQASSPKVAPPQTAPPASSRQAAIEQEQAAKVPDLQPYKPNKVEAYFNRFDRFIEGATPRWHPFFENAYSGGGFTVGLGHSTYVSPYNFIDVRGSYSIAAYKRVEAEFVAPRMFDNRGRLSILGGWREATQVGFYGIGTDTSKDDRHNYLFNQPYASALLSLRPTRRILFLRGGAELSRWSQEPGEGSFPSVEEKYTPDTLPGLGARVTYLHTQGTVALDGRTSPGYT